MDYHVSFHCPENGLWMSATYALGKIRFDFNEELAREDLRALGIPEEEIVTEIEVAKLWAARFRNARCRSVEEANDLLQRVGIDGFFDRRD